MGSVPQARRCAAGIVLARQPSWDAFRRSGRPDASQVRTSVVQHGGQSTRPGAYPSAREAFDGLINDVVRREGFADAHDRVAFVGVSQGAIVTLDAVASGRWKVGALVAFSGLLPPQPVSPASNSTPVLLVHGENDTTIPPMASRLAAAQLATAGFKVELDVERGTGHTISSAGAQKALSFLKKTLL